MRVSISEGASASDRGAGRQVDPELNAVVVNWETAAYTVRAARALLDDGLRPSQLLIVANVGARARVSGDYLFINNDAFVNRQGSVAAMAAALERDAAVGIVTARVLRPDSTVQPTVVALQTPAVAFVRASGLSRFIPNRWQPSWGTHWDLSSSREIQAVSTVAVLVRRAAWEQLGGFDEGIFMYGDDLDF